MGPDFVDGTGALIVYTADAAKVDICFIHGLNGGRISTWKKGDVFWPYNLLPKDIKEARVITWGYDADIAHFLAPLSANRVKDHAKNLLTALRGVRDTPETSDRPIIFVTHSLGGIVCAQSLLPYASMESEETQQIAKNTFGLAFMSTPFAGSETAEWARFFERLFAGSQFSVWLNSAKQSEDSIKNIRAMFFYEEMPTVAAGLVVSPNSSRINGWPSLALHDNHAGICKFDNFEDPKYKQVLPILKKWVDELKPYHGKETSHYGDTIVSGKNYGGSQTGDDLSQGKMVRNQNTFVSSNGHEFQVRSHADGKSRLSTLKIKTTDN
ncbi:hypothetical protein ACLMJK_001920 [Lecanora helva]